MPSEYPLIPALIEIIVPDVLSGYLAEFIHFFIRDFTDLAGRTLQTVKDTGRQGGWKTKIM